MALDYAGAVALLDRYVNFEQTPAPAGARSWDLDAFRLFLGDLGYPERAFPSVLVAGTKGKGSVATLVAAALAASGRRVGLYTSPHLGSLRERIAVGGAPISESDFAERIACIAPALEGRGGGAASFRTWFEIVTAAAFLHFRAERVDVAVLEVGLGGRLDATNVVEPEVSVVTSISLDHTKTLGSTLEEIAREKAGILRDGGVAVFAPQPPPARRVLVAEARRRSATVFEAGRDFTWRERRADARGGLFDYAGEGTIEGIRLGLAGAFQFENAAVALRAVEALGASGFRVAEPEIRSAFAGARWPGRFEVFPGEPAILLDGAHNPYSIEVLMRSVARVFPGRRVVALFAASRDKDQAGMLAALAPAVSRVVFTEASALRAAPAPALIALAQGVAPVRPAEAVPTPLDALARARALAEPDDLLLVTGSLYLVGAVREALLAGAAVAPPRDAVLHSRRGGPTLYPPTRGRA
jgi:dihydrofolate synthase/folylpolyglutamate synthase